MNASNNGDLTLDELYAAANEMCRRHWGVDYTGTIELVNREWKAAEARYGWRGTEYRAIRMSRKTNARLTREDVLGNLLHELVHWRLHTLGVPFDDTDDEFIAECLRVDAPLSYAKGAQQAYRTYLAKRAYEERTGRKYDEEVPA
ncbi:hypothetical protein [Paenibacillus elgii]|uniref:hypothetical protein n=1 Tax=Paenibacillus elgii TaxID=189691 RepID=UPI000248DED6|nr:hypothetical protein [Paenibacillus elgii]